MVLQGERDPFGKREEFPNDWLPNGAELHWIPDGEHSFKARKKSEATTEGNFNLLWSIYINFASIDGVTLGYWNPQHRMVQATG